MFSALPLPPPTDAACPGSSPATPRGLPSAQGCSPASAHVHDRYLNHLLLDIVRICARRLELRDLLSLFLDLLPVANQLLLRPARGANSSIIRMMCSKG